MRPRSAQHAALRRPVLVSMLAGASLLVMSMVGCAGRTGRVSTDSAWTATWMAAPQRTEQANMPPAPGLAGNTLRQVLHLTIGGSSVRVKLSNEFGDDSLFIDAVSIGRRASTGVDVVDTHPVRFGGRTAPGLAAGDTAVSDPIDLVVAPQSDVVVSIVVRAAPSGLTGHPGSRAGSFVALGNQSTASALTAPVRTEHWYLVSRIDARGSARSAVVVLGNSIADGRGSGTDRNTRWPDNLARRLQGADVSVLNAGIGGNAVVRGGLGQTALLRYERDVLRQPGVRWVIVSEGVNDIGGARGVDSSASIARQLTGAYATFIERAHGRGLRIYGATLLPFGGSFYDSPEHEAARQTVNAWIRAAHGFDGVIDFDAAMRDSVVPTRLRAEVDGGDHLHPSEAGYRRMADAIDLTAFRTPR